MTTIGMTLIGRIQERRLLMTNTDKTRENSLVGIWAPVSGNPAETMEYRADGSVRMAMFGGAYHMAGSYRFVEPDVIEIGWGISPSAEADKVVGALNEGLTESGAGVRLGVVRTSVLQVMVTESELKTLHLEKGRIGHFRRIS